ncbi:hypothetical protein SNE40_011438 [Patella caerulea]|uniref:Uncharacterized protein n=1 Tax=Patella caerulea TaxID=87958 RepID=A0AAN8JJN6_PATCE
MAILKIIQPDEIIFHYVRLPIKREHNSATWIEDLQREVTILTFEPKPDVQLCQQFYADRSFTDTHISGLFIDHNVVISNLTREHAVDKLKYTCNSHDEYTCNKHSRNPPNKQIIIKASQTSKKQNNHYSNTEVINCPTLEEFYRSWNSFSCVEIMKNINVDDILYGDAHFVKLARSILYGSEKPVEPISSIDNLIPVNGHVITERFSFLTYVSIYSAVKIGGFKFIFFHGKYKPTSQFWDKLQTLDAQIVFVAVDFEQFPTSTHSLLQYSFYLLLQYGGVVFRENVIWLKPLTIEIRKYDTVASLMNPTEISTGGRINFNILMAKTGSKFLQGLIPLHQQLSRDYSKTETDFALNAYHLYEQQPSTLFLFEDLMYTVNCDQKECFSKRDNPRQNDKLAVFLQFSASKTQLNFNAEHLGQFRQLDSGINIILNDV